MSTSEPKSGERVRDVRVTDDAISVDLFDGRTITVPLWHGTLGCYMLRWSNGRTGVLLGPGTEYTGRTLMRISPPRVSCKARLLLVEGQKRHRDEACRETEISFS
jgi:hypothetical protein